MKFATTIFALCAASAAAFAPMPMKAVRSSSALNERFEVIVCTQCGGEQGTNAQIDIELIDKDGTSARVDAALGDGSDNYHQGSVDFKTLSFNGVNEPKTCRIHQKGSNPWTFGAVFITSIPTGQVYTHLNTHTLKSGQHIDLALEDRSATGSGVETKEFEKFDITVDIGTHGTNALFYVKMIDAQGRSNTVVRPGNVDDNGVTDPRNDWADNGVQTSSFQISCGVDDVMGPPEDVLLFIKKNHASNPRFDINKATINGSKDGEKRAFIPTHDLRENKNKWDYQHYVG